MSTMKNYLGSFLSRLALCTLAAPLILLSPTLVRADAITTFEVSGTAKNISGRTLGSCAKGATCDFSGTIQVDTTKGMVESVDITYPGLSAFNSIRLSVPIPPGDWGLQIADFTDLDATALEFTTAPTPASLVGFTGGLINVSISDALVDYDTLGGSITPAPEPSSLVLFASGMLVLGLTRRFGNKVGHPLSA